jgi:hypothetical protein
MQISTVMSSRINLFTNPPISSWDLLPYMLLCCPRPTPHRLSFLLNARPLAILVVTGAVSMEVGIPTSSAVEATVLPSLD